MALWSIQAQTVPSGEFCWHPTPAQTIKLRGFTVNSSGACVIVECDCKPHPEASSVTEEALAGTMLVTKAFGTKVFLVPTGVEYHRQGCNCADCNFVGKSYGVCILTLEAYERSTLGDNRLLEAMERIWGPSPQSAMYRAKARALDAGYVLVDRPV